MVFTLGVERFADFAQDFDLRGVGRQETDVARFFEECFGQLRGQLGLAAIEQRAAFFGALFVKAFARRCR